MTILAEPLYFDGSVLKTSLHNATEICVRARIY